MTAAADRHLLFVDHVVGVRSASGMSGNRIRMARFYQLIGTFALGD
ncbi:MAG: hypothetical protein ACHRXM_39735 [Isosphaerales bacterium]